MNPGRFLTGFLMGLSVILTHENSDSFVGLK